MADLVGIPSYPTADGVKSGGGVQPQPQGAVVSIDVPDTQSHFGTFDVKAWLPPQYFTDPRAHFPVVLLIHGNPGDNGSWLQGGAVSTDLVSANAGKPVILMMPTVLQNPATGDSLCMDTQSQGGTFLLLRPPTSRRRESRLYPHCCTRMTRIVAPTGFGGPEQLTLTEGPTPEPGAGEVRVAVRAIGVNPIDWKMYGGFMGRDPAALNGIGYELAGVVDAVGEGVDGWAVGDEVIATEVPGNGYTDQAVVPAAGLIAKPDTLSWEQASGIPVAGGTAAHAVEAARVAEGDVVLVHGAAGGVGGFVVQLAKRRGARVVATASERNHDYLRSLGAEPVTYGDGLLDRVQALAPGGVDAAIDTIGSDEAVDVSLELVPDRRRIVSVAAFGRSGDGIHLIGSGGPEVDPGTEVRRAARPEVARLVADGELGFPVQQTYPLEETAQAHRDGMSGHTRGKLVVLP